MHTLSILGEDANVLSRLRTTLCWPTTTELLPAWSNSDVYATDQRLHQ